MQEIKYIDTHSHLHFPQYDEDREEVISRMRVKGVQTIAVGTDFETSKQAISLTEKYSDTVVGATIGIHPNDIDGKFDAKAFTNILNNKVVGVGECGLDYFKMDGDDKKRQKKLFRQQIEFALENDLPLMLHIRDDRFVVGKVSNEAHNDALKILTEYKKEYGEKLRGTCHFFTGIADIALRYIELDFYVSFPGVITFAEETHKTVREVPMDRILSETDAPYASPIPYRGERNEPSFVVETIEKIAEIKQLDNDIVQKQLIQNAYELFAINHRL